MTTLKAPELLLPAGSLDKMRAAYDFGADAVYAGQPRYSLRARNNEFRLEQIGIGIAEAHARGKKFFLTSNLLPHNDKVRTYIRDIEPIIAMKPDALIMADPGLIMMVRNDSPYKTVKDLVAAAKALPGKLSYGSGGIGGSHHLSGALFEHSAGIDMIHAPYKSGSAAATDLMGGQVHMMFEQMYTAMPAIQGGRMRALAITSKKRSPLLPDLPTMGEQGFPAVEVLNWQGLIGPKGMSPELVKQLNAVCNQALQTAEVKEKIMSQGNEVGGGTPEQFAALIKTEAPRWAKVVRDAKIDPE